MPVQQITISVTEILEWLDGLWEQGDLKEYMTYEESLEFRKSVKEAISLY